MKIFVLFFILFFLLQRALSLHHSMLGNRRINVLYTKGGNKNEGDKKEIKIKNFKMDAMRQQGKLMGSVKDSKKRSARRAKNMDSEKNTSANN